MQTIMKLEKCFKSCESLDPRVLTTDREYQFTAVIVWSYMCASESSYTWKIFRASSRKAIGWNQMKKKGHCDYYW